MERLRYLRLTGRQKVLVWCTFLLAALGALTAAAVLHMRPIVVDHQFSSAGINQTRHRILLDVDVHVSILLPGLTTYTKVSNEISVAETVIVGGVPDTYTYFSTTPDEIENYADEYITNNG